jgi:hypothetical protein
MLGCCNCMTYGGYCKADSYSADHNNQVVYKIQEFITILDFIYIQFILIHNIKTYFFKALLILSPYQL